MKNVYNWALGFFVFFFLVAIFAPIMSFTRWGDFDGRFISAFLFGIVVAMLPTILGFFKIKENNGALFLIGSMVNFIFYFLGYYALNLFEIAERGTVAFFHSSLRVTVEDKVLALFLISLLSSVIIVSLQSISRKAS